LKIKNAKLKNGRKESRPEIEGRRRECKPGLEVLKKQAIKVE
jgi:hypothetical protein